MQQQYQVKTEEIGSEKKIKRKEGKGNAEIKYEDDSSVNSDRKKKGRPKKNPQISSQISQKEQSKIKPSKHTRNSLSDRDAKIEDISEHKHKKQESTKSKLSDSNQNDLCKALMLIKKSLPNRSLEKIIIKLYQSIQSLQSLPIPPENQGKHLNQTFSRLENQSKKDLESNANYQTISQYPENDTRIYDNDEIISNASKASNKNEERRLPDKLITSGKSLSGYHDKTGQSAAISQEFFKKSPSNLQNIQSKALVLQSSSQPMIRSQKKQKSEHILPTRQKNIVFNFKQFETLKTAFHNPKEQQIYKERRLLAQLFVERGYGITKSIDDELPPIDIDRNRYKNLLGSILTMAFRRLESFISNECQQTIKYIDKEQMKSLSGMLLNCRLKLQSSACQTFFKFLRIVFGLGEVSISYCEAIDVYVGISQHVYGKNISLQELENMGKIKNQRNIQSIIYNPMKKVEFHVLNSSQSQILQSFPRFPNQISAHFIEQKEQYMWTTELQLKFINLYLQSQNLHIIQEIIGDSYLQFDNYTIGQYETKLKQLILNGLTKIQQDAKMQQKNLQLFNWQSVKANMIATSPEGVKLRCQILSYSIDNPQCALEHLIMQINEFFDNKDLQNIINDINIEFSQPEDESLSQKYEENKPTTFEHTELNNTTIDYNETDHIISKLFY